MFLLDTDRSYVSSSPFFSSCTQQTDNQPARQTDTQTDKRAGTHANRQADDRPPCVCAEGKMGAQEGTCLPVNDMCCSGSVDAPPTHPYSIKDSCSFSQTVKDEVAKRVARPLSGLQMNSEKREKTSPPSTLKPHITPTPMHSSRSQLPPARTLRYSHRH